MRRHAHNLTAAPPDNEGLFLSYPILSICGLVPFISFLTVIPQLIVGIMCMAQLCSGAHFLKAQSEQTA